MEVRRARAVDWEVLRDLRLRALADAPEAFASTLEAEMAFPDAEWRRRAAGGPGSARFIAREGDAEVGLAAVFAEPEAPGRMHLVSMWVDPRHRRRGVARALYERAGFRPTGERQPLPSNPELTESMLRLHLEEQGGMDMHGPLPICWFPGCWSPCGCTSRSSRRCGGWGR